MAWPSTILGIVVEIFIVGTGWVNITTDVRRDGGINAANGVRIEDGVNGGNTRIASPSTAKFKINNRSGKYSPRNPASPYYRLLGLNTQLRITIEGEGQFWGEVSSGWPTRWMAGGADAWVPMEAAGRSRRTNANGQPAVDALQYAIQHNAGSTGATGEEGAVFYWPLTDAEGSVVARGAGTFTSTTGVAQPDLTSTSRAPLPFAHTTGPDGSSRSPDFSGQGTLVGTLPAVSYFDGGFTCEVWVKTDTGDSDNFTAIVPIQLDFTGGSFPAADLLMFVGLGDGNPGNGYFSFDWSVYDPPGGMTPPSESNRSENLSVITGPVPGDQGTWHQILIGCYQVIAGVCELTIWLDGQLIGSDTNSTGTYTLGRISRITVNPTQTWLGAASYAGVDAEGINSIAHVAIYNWVIFEDITTTWNAGRGWRGETAGRRIERLLAQEGIGFASTGDLDDTATMGPQRADRPLATLLAEAAAADGGILADARTLLGYHYRPRMSLYNQTPALNLVYTDDGHLWGPLDPAESDFDVVNIATFTGPDGDEVTETKTSGDRNVNEPEDDPQGVGPYKLRETRNVDTVQQLRDAAAWAVRVGSLDAPRFPSVPLNLLAMARRGLTSLAAAAAGMQHGDVLSITDTPVWIPDDVAQLTVGRQLLAANYEYEVVFNLQQATSWTDVGGPLEDGTFGRLDSDDTVLLHAVTSGATTVRVKNTGSEGTPTLWGHADGDYIVQVGDEEMNVTAVTTMTPTFIAAGTVAHADNAAVTPGLPAGLAQGHCLLLFAAIRNTSGDLTIGTPGGWEILLDLGHVVLAAKTYNGTDTASQVTPSGGAAGDSVSAVLFAFSGVQPRLIDYATSTNGSAQNIAVPSITPRREGCLVLQLGWKADDWTSVAALAGSTEIVDASTTLGSDQGLVVDYRVQSGSRALVDASTFVVTGGASAVSKGAVVLVDTAVQQFTVARAQGGTTAAAHAQGDQLQLANSFILAW